MSALFVAVTAMACANAKPSNPAIWKVCDQDNCLYLLGSFHALQPSDYPLSQAIQNAYTDAELLAFEITPEQMQSAELAKQMQQSALLSSNESLQAKLPPQTWQLLLQWISKNPSYSVETVQRLKPWYMALIITNTQAQAQGFKPEQGIDQHMMQRAKNNKKASIGLERAEQQIRLFDDMNLKTQIQLLQESLQPADAQQNELNELHSLWKNGDVAGMEKIVILKMQHEYPDLYVAINVNRNNAWIPTLQNLLDAHSQQDVLVVVGALHLIGPDGLVRQLQKKGYKIERLN
ncbi:MAG: TraB/GumN family protein [Arenimonas sp.]|nr:TraB/GumN family protein [Arenimonas sp.]